MTADRDIARLLDAWFADGPMQVSDRAFDEAIERVHRERQRPAWRTQLWRLPAMSTPTKFALAGAALLIALLGTTTLFSGGGPRPGSSPPATPAASPAISPTSDPTVAPSLRSVSMEVQGDAAHWSAAVPERWTGSAGWFLTKGSGTVSPTGIAVAATGAVNVPRDPCDGVGKVSVAESPADVVAELETRDDLTVSDAIATSLGGYAGLQVDVEIPADLSACDGSYIIFAEPDGSGYYAQGPSNLLRLWILDVEGRPVVFWTERFAGTPAEDVAEAEGIVDSIVITP